MRSFYIIIHLIMFCIHTDLRAGEMMTVAACRNGEYIYSVADGGVNIFNENGQWIQNFRDPDFRIFDIQSSGIDGQLFVCGGTPGVDGKVGILTCEGAFDRNEGKPLIFRLQKRELGDDLLYRCRFDQLRSCLYAAGENSRVYRIPVRDGILNEAVRIASMASAVHAMDLDEKSGLLAIGGRGGEMTFINLNSDSESDATTQYIADHTAGVTSIIIPPGGDYVLSGSADARIRVHLRSGRLVLTVTGIQYHSEGQTLDERMRQTSVLTLEALGDEPGWTPDSGGVVAGTSTGAVFHLSGGKSTPQIIHKPNLPPGAVPAPIHQILMNVSHTEILIPRGNEWIAVKVPAK